MNEDLKRCSKCKTISSICNFNKDLSTKDGLNPICKVCRIGYYNKKHEQKLQYQKLYAKQNRARINNNEKNKRKTDFNYKIAHNIRVRTNKAFKSQNVRKLNKTFDLVGCSQSFFKRWILHQLYGDMTEENYSPVWTLEHCHPLSKTNLSDKNEMNKSTYWINIRPMYCSENISKGDKINPYLYILQEIKAKYFLKLNIDQGRLNENIH